MAENAGEVTVRVAGVDDASGIARVHIESWRGAYEGIVADEFLASIDPADRTERWHENLEQGPRRAVTTWVAENDHGLVGFASLGPSRDEDAERSTKEIYAIYLEPDAWGHGVARELMRTVLAEVPDEAVTLWVLAANDRARKFYRRHGFTPDGTERFETIGDQELLEVRYRRN